MCNDFALNLFSE